MSEKLVRCFAHWERRGEAVSEGLHLVNGEWMCEPCFTGRLLLQESEREGDPVREAQLLETRRARLPKVLDGRGCIVRQCDNGMPGLKATPLEVLAEQAKIRNFDPYARTVRKPRPADFAQAA